MFDLKIDRERIRLEITLWGFWDVPTVDRFERDMIAALRELKRLGSPTTSLIDGRIYPVQSQEIIARHERLLAGLGDLAADWIALVQPSHLVRLQAARAAGELRHRVFASKDEAHAWLDASTTRQAA